ncbi:hypothetical protein C2S52_011659 [Perilla frutescens var. hirtella]|nr:hypothetical protein C2S52_011659 [Perilla frutescens var. hirtella]KAH6785706.1 hypothetical protein C2S51_038161 [Perilla frutescens var. frutescens]
MPSAIEAPYFDSFGVFAKESTSLQCRKVLDFKDKYGMVLPYFQKFEFEDEEDFDPKEYCKNYCDTDDEEDIYEVANPRETLVKYVNQIRNSFTNETYALMEVEKAVLTRHRIMLLTLSTKKVVGNRNTNADAAMETIQAMVCIESDGSFELDQWRIKPAPVGEDA